MARAREFDPNQALDHAMTLFWAKGYGDTSMDEIVATTGVSRYGLYSVFGNKRELFIQALRRYAQRMLSEVFVELSDPDASLVAIEKGFRERLFDRREREMRRGCMFCNTATAVAPHDKFIAAAMRDMFEELAKLFENALANAKQRGEVRADLDPKASAFYLVGVLQALAVLVRVGFDKAKAEEFVSTALETLT